MCGICGIITKKDLDHAQVIHAMMELIIHRGPDGSGIYLGEGFSFGHRRLSIIDLSDMAGQPMKYKEYIITYNGEVYNYIELKKELSDAGYIFETKSDTEVIMAAYDYWGEECVSKFNGMWSFALYDMKRNRIFCSRDRFGVKPFYYTIVDGVFYFASEIKQFTVVPGWKPRANLNRVYDFLHYGITNHTNETLFDQVYQLKEGHNLSYNLSSSDYTIRSWYQLEYKRENKEVRFPDAVTNVRKIFSDAINLRLRSDVKVGSCLSGGIDSSAIVCMANFILSENGKDFRQETVTASYKEKEYNEEKYADLVTSKTGTISHKVYPDFKDLFEKLDKITWHQDEPFLSTSIFAQWCVFEEAEIHEMIVMLDGQGADEYLAGYDNLFGINLADLLLKGKIILFLKELRSAFKNYSYQKAMVYIFWFFNNIFYRIKFFPEKIRLALKFRISHKSKNWLKIKGDKTVKKIYEDTNKSLQHMSLAFLKNVILPTLLHYEDRNSMAHSIESRVPFLDYRLVEYILSLPSEYKIRQSRSKFVFREAMRGILPDELIERKDKLGFATPQEKWIKENHAFFRNEIKEACNTLNRIVDEKTIMNWFDHSITNNLNFKYNFWSIISLAYWVKKFNVEL